MKILIVKASALGDIVHAFPVVGFLREKFPAASIDWVVERPFASLVSSHPFVSRVIAVDTKSWRSGVFSSAVRSEIGCFFKSLRQEYYDVIFDLQANTKSGLITLLARGKDKVGYTWSGVSEWPNLACTNRRIEVPKGLSVRDDYLCLIQSYFNLSEPFTPQPIQLTLSGDEQEHAKALLGKLKVDEQPLVMVCHGSNWPNKQLAGEALLDFLRRVQAFMKCKFVLTWGSDKERVEALSLQKQLAQAHVLEKLSLPSLQYVMSQMQLVIAMDSLPLHLAATTQTPTFSVFGASLACRYAPRGSRHFSYQGGCPYKRVFETRCPILRSCPTGACIRSITGSQLFEAFLKAPLKALGQSD